MYIITLCMITLDIESGRYQSLGMSPDMEKVMH